MSPIYFKQNGGLSMVAELCGLFESLPLHLLVYACLDKKPCTIQEALQNYQAAQRKDATDRVVLSFGESRQIHF